MATVSEQLWELFRRLDRRRAVTRVNRDLDIRLFGQQIDFDASVEADLENGHTVVFCLNARGRDQWTVTPEIRVQTDAGQDLIRTVDSVSVTADDLPGVLTEMAMKLVAALEEVDLDSI